MTTFTARRLVRSLLDALDAAEASNAEHVLRAGLLREQVAELEAERDALREWQERVAIASGLAEDLRAEGRCVLVEDDAEVAAEWVGHLREYAADHADCWVLCDEHEGEQWEAPNSCPACSGSGMDGPAVVYWGDGPVPNNLAHPGDCDTCGGDGRDHESPRNLVAVAERDRLAAAVERVRAIPVGPPSGGYFMLSMRDVLRALDGGE